MQWLEKVAIPFVERWWKPIAVVVLALLAVLAGKRIIGGVVDALRGPVTGGLPFTPVPGDPTHIIVPANGQGPNPGAGYQVVKLPAGLTADKVGAVAYQPGYLARVQVKGGNG